MKAFLKKNIKQKYTVEFHQVTNLKGLPEGTEVFMKWRRGDKKENKGHLDKGQVHGGTLLYSPAITVPINCTLFLKKKEGYDEKGMEVSVWTATEKPKELCKGMVNLAKYADLDGKKITVIVSMKGKNTGDLQLLISSGVGVETASEDETEVLQMHPVNGAAKSSNLDVHELLIQEVSKTNHEVQKEKVIKNEEEDDKEEKELIEKQRRQKELQEKEDAERKKKAEEAAKEEAERQKSLFSAAAMDVKIKGKKDNKKKFTQEDLDTAIEKAVEKVTKELTSKSKKREEELLADFDKKTKSAAKEKDKDGKISELNNKLQEETKQKENTQAALQSANSLTAELKGTISNKENEAAEMKKTIEEKENKKNQLEKEIEDLKKKVDDEAKAKEAVAGELAVSAALAVELKGTVAKKEEDIEELKKKVEEVEKNAAKGSEDLLRQKNEEIEKIKNEKHELIKEVETFKKYAASDNLQIKNSLKYTEDLRTENEKVKKELQNVQNEKEKIVTQLQNEKTQNKDLEQKLEELEREKYTTLSQLENEKAEKIAYTKKLEESQANIKNLETLSLGENDKAKEVLEKIQNENETLRIENEKMRNDYESKIKSLKESNDTLSSEVSENKDLCEKNQKRNKELQLELDALKQNKETENSTPVESITDKIVKGYVENKKDPKGFSEVILSLATGDNEITEIEVLRSLGNTLEENIYLLSTMLYVLHKDKVEKFEKRGDLQSQLCELLDFFFKRTVQVCVVKYEGFLEGIIEDNQCFEKRQAAEYELVSAGYILRHMKYLVKTLSDTSIERNVVKQLMSQIVNFVTYKVIELLVCSERVTFAKGLQLKFFFSILEGEMEDSSDLKPYVKYLMPAVEISGLLVVDMASPEFNIIALKENMPHVSGSVMYAVLNKYRNDKKQPLPKDILDKINKTDVPVPSCLDLVC
ncbi:DNA double-strand break repair Rad50 ATPase, putative [Entamoeba invadens IP1]|uniref:DNA double-strand break repair Rad50 ATPase, putative n=1 Tax=Entamoeba invadens IP1 TaxID=370355 RepID=A0A0A1U5D6_ENTIV|nr:DNA double-strand break repair Rad50 ATPase, putative [Entamoeba invadens IP1]ELP89509.1 DNA double-strand break repair Rad50 ATPase, putative [Entamoeba invadens IP1]|eukprot:XP_004256280.1 DNA double-strand break repair Rad50 ATPase, putative [Entamoeba invadens IP1]